VIPQLKTEVSKLKTDVGGVKEDVGYLENTIIEAVKSDITDVNNLSNTIYGDISKLKSDTKELQQKVQAL
jgi:hypothetical protein